MFKAMIDQNLNENFNLSNLLVFLKLYTYHFESRFKEYNIDPTKATELTPDMYN